MAVDFSKGMILHPNFDKNNLPAEGQLVLLGILNDGAPDGNAATIDATALLQGTYEPPTRRSGEVMTYDSIYDNISRRLINSLQPIGTIIPILGTAIPSGYPSGVEWMICDGSSISKYTYSELYQILGNTYGASTDEFNLPNLTQLTEVHESGDLNYVIRVK